MVSAVNPVPVVVLSYSVALADDQANDLIRNKFTSAYPMLI